MAAALMTENTSRVYLACLASYNTGKLHGKWVDLPQDMESLRSIVTDMLETSSEPCAEEWAIHDYEGFGHYRLSEHEGLRRAVEIASFIQEHGEIASQVLEHYCGGINAARKAMKEEYAGCHESLESFVEEWMEDAGQLTNIPDKLCYYIDFKGIARDMELNGELFTIEAGYNQVHVFWNN